MKRRIFRLLIVLIPLAVLLAGAGSYVLLQVRQVSGKLGVLLVDEIQRDYKREVHIGKVTTRPFGSVVIDDLAIADKEKLKDGTVLKADKVVIKYNWLALILRKQTPVQTVSSITLMSPDIRIRRNSDGTWNFADFLVKKPGPKKPPFIGKIIVKDGNLALYDYQAKVPGVKPAVTRITGLETVVDAVDAPVYSFKTTARGVGGRFDRMTAQGTVYAKEGRCDIDIAANNVLASYWTKYLSQNHAFNITKGRGDISLNLTYEKVKGKPKWDYIGEAFIRNGSLNIKVIGKQAEKVSGRVRFTKDTAVIDGKGVFAGGPFGVRGSIVDFSKPRLNLNVNSGSADFHSVMTVLPGASNLKDLKLSGRGPLALRITGPVNGPVVKATARVPSASLYGRRASGLSITGTYADKRLTFEKVTGSALGGSFSLSGTIATSNPIELNIGGVARSVDLAAFPMPKGVQLTGTATGSFTVIGTTRSPIISTNVQVSRANINNVLLSNASMSVVLRDGIVTVRQADAGVVGGNLTASGVVSPKKLDLKVVAKGVSLQQVAKLVGEQGYSGTLFYQGRVSGSPSSPVASGTAEIFNGKAAGYGFNYARGQMVVRSEGIDISNAIVRLFPGQAVIRGRITRPADKPVGLDLTVDASRMQASRLLRMLRISADIEGILKGQLKVTGNVPDVTVTGNVSLEDGTAAGIPISTATTDLEYAKGILKISNARATSDSAEFVVNGSVNTDGNLALGFKVTSLAMARLNPFVKPYVELTGNISEISGSIQGALSSPDVSVTASAEKMTINDVPFDSLKLQGSLSDGVVNLSTARLTKGTTSYAVDSAVYDSNEQTLKTSGSLKDVEVEQIIDIISKSPYLKTNEADSVQAALERVPKPLNGMLNISFSTSGPFANLDASVNGSVTGLKVGAVDVDSVQANLKVANGDVSVEDFSAISKELNVNIRPGVVYANGSLNLDLTVANVDAAVLAPYIRPLGLAGTVTVDALVTGSPQAPAVTASVEMENPVISGVSFDRLRASRIAFTQNSVDISDVILSKGSHQMVFYGALPWDWSTMGVPSNLPMDFHAQLEHQSLALLNVLTNEIEADGTSGEVSGSLDVSGTLNSPITRGSFNVTDGSIAFRQTDAELKNVQAALVFDGENVKIDRLSMSSSLGGTVSVEPGGVVSLKSFPDATVDLALVADKFRFKEANLMGYKEQVSAVLDSKLTVSGPLKSPMITGTAQANNGNVIIPPSLSATNGTAKEYAVNPKFDIQVTLGSDMWFRNPRVVARTPGTMSIKGSLSSPQVKGKLNVVEGYLRLPTTRLRLTKGGSVEFTYTPPEPVRIVLNMQGRTTTSALSPLGVRRQYEITMTVRGPLDNLDVDLQSSPPDLSNQRMLALMGHVEDIFTPGDVALKQDLTEVFTTLAGGAVLEPLETAVSEALGLQEFRVEYSPGEPLGVFVAREVFPNFSVSYWRTLNAISEDYFVRLSYQLTNKYAIGYTMDEQRKSTLEANYIFRF